MQNDTNPFEPQPEQPNQATQPAPTPQTVTVEQPVTGTTSAAPVQEASQKSKLALWALILSIVGLVTGFIFFLSAPLALAALIMSIIALKKHASRKGMSIAALIMSIVTLVIIVPLAAIITLVAYNGITERANEVLATAAANEQAANLPKVNEQCYEFTLPEGYELSTTGTNCIVTLSIEKNVTDNGTYTSSDLEEINVTPLTGEVPSLRDVRQTIVNTTSAQNGVVSQGEELEVNGNTVYKFEAEFTSSTFAYYYVIDQSESFASDEAPITGYKIVGQSGSADSLAALELIINSFTLKQ